MSGKDKRKEILNAIEQCVCKDRMTTHGDAEDNFKDIADIWTIQLGAKLSTPLTSVDVAALMVGMKLARIKHNPKYLDNWVDVGGYAVCGGGIVLNT